MIVMMLFSMMIGVSCSTTTATTATVVIGTTGHDYQGAMNELLDGVGMFRMRVG